MRALYSLLRTREFSAYYSDILFITINRYIEILAIKNGKSQYDGCPRSMDDPSFMFRFKDLNEKVRDRVRAKKNSCKSYRKKTPKKKT